jgi:hypothetical protein
MYVYINHLSVMHSISKMYFKDNNGMWCDYTIERLFSSLYIQTSID